MNDIFTIGDFCFRLECPDSLTIPENFLKFRGGTDSRYSYTITLSDTFPAAEGRLIARRPDLLVVEGSGGECRYIGVKGTVAPYACYMETAADSATILLRPDQAGELVFDPVFSSLLSLERRLLERDSLILHCAFVEYQGEAILFSAPSETGKTTQAGLWQRYRGAATVNGDRCLLQKMDGRWYARGWPVCGSSGVCVNRDVPIRAIVMLSQAPADRVERLSPMKAFSQSYSQITINRWNKAANLKAMGLLDDLIGQVPVWHLACTMNESAVETLETALHESR